MAALLAAATCSLPAAEPDRRAQVAAALVRPTEARLAPYRWPTEPDIIALYYGADWCAPCHAVVPTLRQLRDQLRAVGAETEVVYVGLETSARATHRYMRRQDMPWPAIDPRRLPALPWLRALGGPAPPSLVLIDRDGRILASSWDGERYIGVQPVMRAWISASHDPTVLGPEGKCGSSSTLITHCQNASSNATSPSTPTW